MKHFAPSPPSVVVYVNDSPLPKTDTASPDICADLCPDKSPDVSRHDPEKTHREFPGRWRAYILANYRNLKHVQQVFNVSERTARKWFAGETGCVGGHVAVAIIEHPVEAAQMLFAAEYGVGGALYFSGDGQKSGLLSGHLFRVFAKLQSALAGTACGALCALHPPAVTKSAQKVKCLHRRFGMNVTPEHFANAVGIGAQFLNNIGKRRTLLSHDVCRNGFINIQRFALNCDFVQINTRYRVLHSCHGGYLLMAILTKGSFQVPMVVVGRISQRCGNTGRVSDSQSLTRQPSTYTPLIKKTLRLTRIWHKTILGTRDIDVGHRFFDTVYRRFRGHAARAL